MPTIEVAHSQHSVQKSTAMSPRIIFGMILVLVCIQRRPASAAEQEQRAATDAPAGPTEDGFLLPNGWKLSPAGKQVLLTDLPLNILVSDDSRFAFVASSGYNAHELAAVDLAAAEKLAVTTAAQSWFGLAADFKRSRFWWSGGGEGTLLHFAWS